MPSKACVMWSLHASKRSGERSLSYRCRVLVATLTMTLSCGWSQLQEPPAFVNEFMLVEQVHAGAGAGFVEVAAALDHGLVPVLPLEELSVVIYENGLVAQTLAMTEFVTGGGTVGIIRFYFARIPAEDMPSIPFALALVYEPEVNGRHEEQVLQFIGYGNAPAAANGPAQGIYPVDTGIDTQLLIDAEDCEGCAYESVGLQGSGDRYTDFTWGVFHDQPTIGSLNSEQMLGHIQHTFYDPNYEGYEGYEGPEPEPRVDGPVIIVGRPEPEPLPDRLRPEPEPEPAPRPEPIEQPPLRPTSMPEPVPEPDFELRPAEDDPSSLCNTVPTHTQRGVRDQRLDARSLRIGTFNLGGLFDGVNDETGMWAGGTNCPGYHTNLNACDSAGSAAHAARLKEIILRMDVDILNVNEVEDCAILSDFADDFRGYRTYMPERPFFVTALTPSPAGLVTRLDPSSDLRRCSRCVTPVSHVTFYPVHNCDTSISGSICAHTTRESQCGDRYAGSATTQHYQTEFEVWGMRVAFFGLNFAGPAQNDSTACARREAQAAVIQNLAREALKIGQEVVICGDLNDYDGTILDEQHHVPISRVLSMLQDVDGDRLNDLQNVAALLHPSERYTAWMDRNRDGNDDEGDEHAMIDHMLLSPGLFALVKTVTIDHSHDATEISGHWPLVVELQLDDSTSSGFADSNTQNDAPLPYKIIGLSISASCLCAVFICCTTKWEKGKQSKFTQWFGLDRGEFTGIKIPAARPTETEVGYDAYISPAASPTASSANPLGTISFEQEGVTAL